MERHKICCWARLPDRTSTATNVPQLGPGLWKNLGHIRRTRSAYNLPVCGARRALYFLVPMLLEQGLGTLPSQRDHLALDEPKAGADLAHLNPGSGCRSGAHSQTPFPTHSMILAPQLILELAVLGLCTGYVAGLLGIGGGMLLGPFITIILSARGVPADLAVKMSIATSMATIIFTSISSVRAHHQRGAVRWNIVKGLAPGIVLGSMVGSIGVFSVLKGTTLALIFAGFISFSATQMILGKAPKPGRQMPGFAGLLGAGSVIGLVSGLVGAGGGFVSVPFMVAHNVLIINAVATSAALGFPIALANAAGYAFSGKGVAGLPAWSLGYIWLPALAVVASCSVLTAPWGAKMAHSMPVARLKRVFAAVLYALAAYMLWKGLLG